MKILALAWLAPVVCLFAVGPVVGDDIPDMGTLRDIIEEELEDDSYRTGDLLDQKQVLAVFDAIEESEDWVVPDADEIMEKVLPPRHHLIQVLRTTAGRRFMRKVHKFKLIYDRLYRISRVSGGKKMLKALIKLPDAPRYAKFSTRREVPDFLDLLPKQRNGKRRKIANYKKPTHMIFTEADLVRRLEISRATAIRDAKRD